MPAVTSSPYSAPQVSHNNSVAELVELALKRGEGKLASTGALAVETWPHTGRSAADKFIVCDDETEDTVWWDNTEAMTEAQFDRLYRDVQAFKAGKDLFVQDLYGGADPNHRLSVRMVCEYAWHALFIRQLLRRPDVAELANFAPDLTIIDLPSFRAAPDYHGTKGERVIACNFKKGIILIGGTTYAGEMKKSVFTVLNYQLPGKDVMPMHCSANVDDDDHSAVFFGLSGTGKTTLSADARRQLIGDDEHGWGAEGIFNFEGGCYAKTIRLSRQAEPEIWDACNQFGAVLENVVLTPGGQDPDFEDARLTENTRGAYPLDFIANASTTSRAGHPKNIIMLTADAFGILPPIAKLTPSQAMYHFLSGYTAKVAGTERGMGNEPQATFSTCFGAPFMPRHPSVYGNLLRDLIAKHNVDCWLVNTGWTGGKYGEGSRMPIAATRALLDAALSGELRDQAMRQDPLFGFEVPVSLPGIDSKILDPRGTWSDPLAYDKLAAELGQMFNDNFKKYEAHVDDDVIAAAPRQRLPQSAA
ncbi:MAG: phosphoenolpyruvate carboxykinase [Alphaproteobacteria bacterium]|nr:phosphoenolpyruvate carboxykinase [Alphaproteobacteria bacterium]